MENPTKIKRLTNACVQCRISHLRCDGNFPCARCKNKNCYYTSPAKRGKKPVNPVDTRMLKKVNLKSKKNKTNKHKNPIKWTKDETEQLIYLANIHNNNWVLIGTLLNKESKQCREKWLNSNNVINGKLSQEEKNLICHYRKIYGNRWTKISSLIPGRSANQIKNYWHCTHRRYNNNDSDDYLYNDNNNNNKFDALVEIANLYLLVDFNYY